MNIFSENRNSYVALGYTLLFHALLFVGCILVVLNTPNTLLKINPTGFQVDWVLDEPINTTGSNADKPEKIIKPEVIAESKSQIKKTASEKVITDENGEEVNLLKELLRKKIRKQQETAEVQSLPSTVNAQTIGNENGTDGSYVKQPNSKVYYLNDRNLIEKPVWARDTDKEGIVVVEIIVDENGNVTKAIPGKRGSTTTDEVLYHKAQQAAMQAKFNASPGVYEQRGTYTFVFTLE